MVAYVLLTSHIKTKVGPPDVACRMGGDFSKSKEKCYGCSQLTALLWWEQSVWTELSIVLSRLGAFHWCDCAVDGWV